MLSCIWLFATLWTVAYQAPLSMEFSRQGYWNGLPFPPPGDLPDPEIKPTSLAFPALAGRFFTTKLLVLIVLNLEITLGRTDVFTVLSLPVSECCMSLWKVAAEPQKMPGYLASGGEEFNLGPETRLDHSELLCNKVLLKYKRDRESFWHRHQKGAERVPRC